MIRANSTETIVAQATPSGRGGVGIVRISGPLVQHIAKEVLGKTLQERYAIFCNFLSNNKKIIDQGLAIYFRMPHSFTGEDVLELHCHGGPVVIDILLQRILELGTRLAKPGEFTERAFLNDKLDLIQAEAVADLINASTSQAAQNAARSLQGEFSKLINKLIYLLIESRVHLEATIDFPEEETEKSVIEYLDIAITNILSQLENLKNTAKQGIILRDGATVVIAGRPNVGKSSLFNYLSGCDMAIVTDIPGTTRDILRTSIQLDGLTINLLDTAGLRDEPATIEKEGIRRAFEEIKKADHVLLLADASVDYDYNRILSDFTNVIPQHAYLTILYNKIDLIGKKEEIVKKNSVDIIYLSVKTQKGLDILKNHLKNKAGFCNIDGGFSARRRHLDALEQAEKYIRTARTSLLGGMIEIVAEDLKQAQCVLGEITGEFTTDELLGKIFSEFCIGK